MLVTLAALAFSATDTLHLIPQPREITPSGVVALAGGIAVDVPADSADRFAARDLTEALRERGIRIAPAATASIRVTLLRSTGTQARRLLAANRIVFTDSMAAEGYAAVHQGRRLYVIGASSAGVFYGAQTIKQLVIGRGASARLHLATIRDWPAMRYRGVHDDLSRGPVPTLEFQKKQIREFAAHKLNVYSPYFEHTLEYRSNPLAAPPMGAMTQEQVRELVAYARQYHMEVIPEQEAFGHLHHLLKWELYAPIAETPHGHVIAPDAPGSMTLIKELFAEIAELFPSPFVHLGADETFELGRGRTAARVSAEGIGPVYLRFLSAIVDSLRPLDKRFLFWGDVAGNHPELVPTLPKDMIAVAWAYWLSRDYEGFVRPYRDAGMEFWVAPGVNNWNRVYPDNSVALRNIQGFVRDGQRLGATGMLNTTWDDDGDALFNQAWYGVLWGAAASWQPGESRIDDFERSFGLVFHGDTTGMIDEAQRKLAAAHQRLRDAGIGDASNYAFWLDPWSSEGQLMAAQVLPAARDVRVLAESALVLTAHARRHGPLRHPDAIAAMELGARRMDWLAAKFQFANEIAEMYARAGSADTTREGRRRATDELAGITHINGRIQDMREGFANLKQLYRQAWLAENRPYWIDNVLGRYDLNVQRWIAREEDVAAAWRVYNRTGVLPAAASIGMPPPIQQSSAPQP